MSAADLRAEQRPVACRSAYRDLLHELLQRDERIYCLDTDSGLFPYAQFGACERFVNLGIAEQNLMAAAAGLAASGAIPFANTMASFAALRAGEFVKIDIACNNLPVRIVATHGGLSGGHFGPTHHATEDLAVMRALPNMTVVVPSDAASTCAAVTASLKLEGPLYLRLGRGPTPPVEDDGKELEIGSARVLRDGADVTIAACGPLPVLAALAAHETLGEVGIAARILELHTVKPLDADAVGAAAAETAGIVTVEDHSVVGGLGSAVCETVASIHPVPVIRVGVPDTFVGLVGEHEELLQSHGVSKEGIVHAVVRLLDG